MGVPSGIGPGAELVSGSMEAGECNMHHVTLGGFELESADAVYRYGNWQSDCGIHEEQIRLIP